MVPGPGGRGAELPSYNRRQSCQRGSQSGRPAPGALRAGRPPLLPLLAARLKGGAHKHTHTHTHPQPPSLPPSSIASRPEDKDAVRARDTILGRVVALREVKKTKKKKTKPNKKTRVQVHEVHELRPCDLVAGLGGGVEFAFILGVWFGFVCLFSTRQLRGEVAGLPACWGRKADTCYFPASSNQAGRQQGERAWRCSTAGPDTWLGACHALRTAFPALARLGNAPFAQPKFVAVPTRRGAELGTARGLQCWWGEKPPGANEHPQ